MQILHVLFKFCLMYVWASGNDFSSFYLANEIVITVKSVRVANGGRKIMYVELLTDGFLNLYVKFGIPHAAFFAEIKANWVISFKS